jgi:hypothetical protein
LLPKALDDILRKIEVGDAVLFLYIAAFARQFFWPLASNRLAWTLTILTSALVFALHWRKKPLEADRTPRVFFLIVLLPLAFFYALRVSLPDMSWDVLDYRLINAERALNGWPMIAGDFFPVRFPFNPAPDMVMGISRHLLGYRLGTIVNVAVLAWTGMILERLLRAFVTRDALRCACVLLLLLTEHLLFEVNNYMVDLLALPLLLEATRLALDTSRHARELPVRFARIGLFLGMSLAFKLTNLAFVIPILLLCAFRMARNEMRFDVKAAVCCVGCIMLPLLPYSLYIYSQTGSPVFPLYNWIFKSPYWPAVDLRTERWGPIVDDVRFKNMSAWEVLVWPLLLPFRVEHTAADLGPHWGRVSLAFIASIATLLRRGVDRRVRELAIVTLLGAMIWSAASGMLRYATYVELIGGLLAIYLAMDLLKTAKESRRPAINRAVGSVIILIMLVQAASACIYGYKFEWGSRPPFFADTDWHLREARYILRDRSFEAFLSSSDRAQFDPNAVWVESDALTSGVQVMLDRDAPQWCLYMPEYFSTDEARARFRRAVEAAKGKPIYSLCLSNGFPQASDYIRSAGLGIGDVRGLSLPFYSHSQKFHSSFLIEVLPPGVAARENAKGVTVLDARLPETAFTAGLRWHAPPPDTLRSGEKRTVRVAVKNASSNLWPALGLGDNSFRLLLGNHWLDANSRIVINDDARNSLPYDVEPGAEVEVPLEVTAPDVPGQYVLEIDLLQERATWFAAKGSPTLKATVTVED